MDVTGVLHYTGKTAVLAATEAAIAVRAKIPHDRVRAILADLASRQLIAALPARGYIHRDTAAEAAERILAQIAAFHRQSPMERLERALPDESVTS